MQITPYREQERYHSAPHPPVATLPKEIYHEGQHYRIVSVEELARLQSQPKEDESRWDWQRAGVGEWVLGLGIMAMFGLTAFAIGCLTRPEPKVFEKPVIVEREKQVPVDRNCLMFCGNNQ